jgi:hypothetical protein
MRPRLTYANVISTVCLFLLLAGGTAIATHPGGQNTISTADIINGEVKVADIGQGAVRTNEIAHDQVKAPDIGDGEVRSLHVANDNLTGGDIAGNSLKGADIDERTLDIGDTARAYARVDPATCTGTPGTCTPEQSKGVSSVTRDSTGRYCVTARGIDSDEVPAAVTVDWAATTGPSRGNASAMTHETFGCGPTGGGFHVVTELQPNILVDQGGIPNNGTAAGPAAESDNVAYTIVIP